MMGSPGEQDVEALGARRSSLRVKLIQVFALLLALAGLSAVAVVAVVEYIIWEHHREVLEERINEMMTSRGEGLAATHAEVLATLLPDNALTAMQRTLGDAVAQDDVVYGAFFDTKGRPWAYCSPAHPCKSDEYLVIHDPGKIREDLHLDQDEVTVSVHPAQWGGNSRRVTLFDVPVIEFAHPVVVDGEVGGTLRYGLSTLSLQSTLDAERRTNRRRFVLSLAALGGIVIATFGLGIVLARRTAVRITRPLEALTVASEALARGDRGVRVSVNSGDEVELLGQSFNKMAVDLDRSYTELEERNAELQKQVREKETAQAERGELQDHLIQAQKMEAFGQLAGGVAHDFNNILAVVMGNTELVRMMLESGQISDAQEFNAEIGEAAQAGGQLTRQLLLFARRETSDPVMVDLESLLKKFEKFIRRVLEESVDLKVEVEKNVPPILVDPGRIEQVLMNLCVNARDAMLSTGGTILVRARWVHLDTEVNLANRSIDPGDYSVVEVIDTGAGIRSEDLQRIFEPFFTTKPAGRGTGLGLAMVHGIVNDAGGAIDVSSEPGKGTTFSLYFPAQKLAPDRADESESPPLPRGQGATVLLCEDEEAVRKMAERLLTLSNFRVTAVSSGVAALEQLQSHRFDLLITDAIMPGMDGGILARLARQRYPGIPVLFVSGYMGGVLKNAGIDEREEQLLRKPFLARELLEKVNEMLRESATDPEPPQ